MLAVGDLVPALEGAATIHSPCRLADARGQWLVLYFYPRDNTPGCTTEARDFRDLLDAFSARNARIIGVSRDTLARHEKFAARQDLPFPLVADVDSRWCDAFGVIGEKKLYGKTHLGIVRSTFLIDPDGRIQRSWRKVRVAGHAREVLEAIPHSP